MILCGSASVELNGVGVREGCIDHFLALASPVQLGYVLAVLESKPYINAPT